VAAAGPFPHRIISADFDGDATIAFDAYGAAAKSGKITIGVGGHTRDITVEGEATPRIYANLGGTP
jgi:hypothetical protein